MVRIRGQVNFFAPIFYHLMIFLQFIINEQHFCHKFKREAPLYSKILNSNIRSLITYMYAPAESVDNFHFLAVHAGREGKHELVLVLLRGRIGVRRLRDTQPVIISPLSVFMNW